MKIAARFASLLALTVAATGALTAAPVRADERILSFESEIRVQPDSVLEVRETIRVRAEGAQIRRGIYRDFPTTYTSRDGRRVITGFDLRFAERNGRLEKHRLEALGNGKRVYVGDPDVMLEPGEHTYVLVYRTDRQLGFFADHDELYWNVTGNGWGFPIDRARAEVRLPSGVPAERITLEAYTGPQGATGRDYSASVETGAPSFETTRTLFEQEGITIVVGWPKGYVSPPGGLARFGYFLRDARPLVAGAGGLLLLIGYYVWIWGRVGRDPPGKIVVPHYEAPAGLSPGAMRFLTRMSYDDRCFGASILGLAVKGQLAIDESEAGLFGLGKKYTLRKTPGAKLDALADDERVLLAELFASGDRLVLESENHGRVNAAKSAHKSSLRTRFTPSFFRINGGWHFLGIVLSLVVVALAVVLPLKSEVAPPWFLTTPVGLATLGCVLAGLAANGVFGRLLKAPTVAGREAMDRLRGFRLYLDVAEGDELALRDAPPLTPQLYETNLPAALALGVEQRWAERFTEMCAMQAATYSPAWYHGDSFDAGNLSRFSSSIGSSLDSAISSASTEPGSSSGGGGGGSSGGGGGGGGGGGW